MSQDIPEFIPDKDAILMQLRDMATKHTAIAKAHNGLADANVIRIAIDSSIDHVLIASPEVWDRHFIHASVCEFCDPGRIAHPDADRYEDLLKQWDEGRFDPEPV